MDINLTIAKYVNDNINFSNNILEIAKVCLLDSLGCAMLALSQENCRKLLGPIVPDTIVPNGSRVPGTNLILDPVQAAFNIGLLIRWLDYNDTWLAAEWGHPSDNIGGILAVADYISKNSDRELTLKDLLIAIIKAYEIQGVLALENSFNKYGFDHVILVKIASSAVIAKLLQPNSNDKLIFDVLSNAWLDGAMLRAYRHGINAGPRKSWAAGDATSRAVFLNWLVIYGGQPGYPQALDAATWGFQDVILKGNDIKINKKLHSYVIDNILFKVQYPAEFHGQTAVEAAVQLHKKIIDIIESGNLSKIKNIDKIGKILITTQEPAMRIINKKDSLNNYAARDHCLQYMVAVALLHGDLREDYYTDQFAEDSKIDKLIAKMEVKHSEQYTKDYYDLDKRAIANAVAIYLADGSKFAEKEVLYPLGHKMRRAEALGFLEKKYIDNLSNLPYGVLLKQDKLLALWQMPLAEFNKLTVKQFIDLWVVQDE